MQRKAKKNKLAKIVTFSNNDNIVLSVFLYLKVPPNN